MQIREFRGKEFINREREIEFIKNWVSDIPNEILWLYGPKSTGKTTLIEYIIEKEWTSNLKIFDKYWIKYINFRRTMVGSYASFINS
ncbi:MAG: ATP-binding protein, partial [Desulfonauticus sp.]|nr:ATP-binding protein [Desulfonauticus sp.]